MTRKLSTLTMTLCLALALAAPAMAKQSLPVFTDLAETAGKAVVFISTEKTVQGGPQGFRQQIPEGHPFKDFFDQFERFFGPQPNQQRKMSALGSGFVITPDGYIVTNNHVIQGADKVMVKFQDEDKEYEAEVIGRDPETDLAVVKVKARKELPYLEFGNSDNAKVGEWVVAIGNPYGHSYTVTAGIISAKHRFLGAGPFDNFLQTDASINPGNSGGPLLNLDGEVIGINTAIDPRAQNIGFAIPSNLASKVIDQLKQGKSVKRGWLGVTIQPVSENDAKALGLGKPYGALINSVVKDQPADKAGLRQGDVIIGVNGETVESNSDLLRKIANMPPGHKAKLTLWRSGKEITRTVTLGERGENTMASAKPGQTKPATELGMTLRPVTNDREAQALGLNEPKGLLVTGVIPDSVAGAEGIRQGDVIIQANQTDVNSVAELKSQIDRARKRGAILLLVKRQGQNSFIALPLEKK